MRSNLAVKWLSLISVKSEKVSKIWSVVKRLSHPMHTGGSSPLGREVGALQISIIIIIIIHVNQFLYL